MAGENQNDGNAPDPNAAAGDAKNGGADGANQQQPPIGGADGAAASLHRPDGLPDHLFGQSDKETLDKVFNAYKGARDAIGKFGTVPDKSDAYAIEWGEKTKAAVEIADDDEMVKTFKTVAFEHGFTDKQMGAIPKFFELAVEKGIIAPEHDNKAELRALAPQGFVGSDDAKEAKGAERVTAADRWIGQLSSERGYDDAMKTELRLLTTTAAGVKVVENFMRSGMGGSVNPGGNGQEKQITKGDLDARIADPRNDSMGEKYDPAFAKETDELFKKFYT